MTGPNKFHAERNQRMAQMYQQGLTLQAIGDHFGMTRERIRQIMRMEGVSRQSGGQSLATTMKQERKKRARDQRSMARYGVDYETLLGLRSEGLVQAYRYHENSAKNRGIEFLLTLGEWVSIWRASGKIHLRGRGKGHYCMSRIRDDGPYAVGNVHIQSCVENSREATKKWIGKTKTIRGVYHLYPGLERPWLAKVGGKSIGYFATAEEGAAARQAYLSAREAINA